MSFKIYNLAPEVLERLDQLGFTIPTPVQEQTIPAALDGRDIISLAQTGSGKTLAYVAPMLTRILKNANASVLVLAPTRELATQIGAVIRDLSAHEKIPAKKITSVVLIGGAAMSQQVRGLRQRPQFIIATPGRLLDHMRAKTVDLRQCDHLIIDEADRMFDMGFAPQVNDVVRRLPSARQTLLFSATFPREVRGLAALILRDPVEIEVRKNERPPVAIEQKMIELIAAAKNDKTLDLINAATGSVVIFTRTKNRTDRLFRYLEEYGVKVTRIHGDRSQGQRNKSIADFRSGEAKVLVATDIAARGLDVPSISDVINYDLPQNTDDYVHRIGRTGRAGQAGQSLSLVTSEDHEHWNYIARKMGLPLIGGAASKQRQNHGQQRKQPHGQQKKHHSHRSNKHKNGRRPHPHSH